MWFTAQVKPVLQEEVFTWEVALVQTAKMEPVSSPSEPAPKPLPPVRQVAKSQPVDPPSDMVMTPVAPRQSVPMVHPVIESPKPVEQKVEAPPQKIEPIEQKVVEVQKPKVEPVQPVVEAKVAATAEPVVPQAPVVAMAVPSEPVFNPSLAAHTYEPPKNSGSVSREAASESEATPSPEDLAPIRRSLMPIGGEPATTASKPSAVPPVRSTDDAAVPGQAESTAPIVAKATTPSPDLKADHRWLAESLWRRVAELKRYPSAARLNGLEGKVVLKAVIRSDGHLAEVSVQKSSGHNVLDAAAIEAVKLACPLHMKHAIGKPLIVVSLPIVYSLAN